MPHVHRSVSVAVVTDSAKQPPTPTFEGLEGLTLRGIGTHQVDEEGTRFRHTFHFDNDQVAILAFTHAANSHVQ